MRIAALSSLLLPAAVAVAQPPLGSAAAPTAASDYVALADMALAAPVVIAADIQSATPIKGADAAGVAPGETRFYVQAATRGLVSGRADIPATISYLVDVPDDARGKRAKLKGVPVLLLTTVPSAGGEVRLIGPYAQLPRTPETQARLRAILEAKLAPDAPPAITGVTRAFHVPGSLPGESESQIFLKTADGRPISLSILRRPGESPRWAVALSEMVDDSAAPPQRDTLLWYRLACGLPSTLPDAALAGLSDSDVAATRADYQLVLAGLGTCRRG